MPLHTAELVVCLHRPAPSILLHVPAVFPNAGPSFRQLNALSIKKARFVRAFSAGSKSLYYLTTTLFTWITGFIW